MQAYQQAPDDSSVLLSDCARCDSELLAVSLTRRTALTCFCSSTRAQSTLGPMSGGSTIFSYRARYSAHSWVTRSCSCLMLPRRRPAVQGRAWGSPGTPASLSLGPRPWLPPHLLLLDLLSLRVFEPPGLVHIQEEVLQQHLGLLQAAAHLLPVLQGLALLAVQPVL